jgi:parallel beta-helix repeat protein
MARLRPGDDVIVAAGVYREPIVVPSLNWASSVTRIRAQTPRAVQIKGSVMVSNWTAGSLGTYWINWGGEEPQQVYRDGVPLQQIGGTVFGGYPTNPNNPLATAHASEGGIWLGRVPGGVNELVANSFTYDANAKRLTLKLDVSITASTVIEVSSLRHPLQALNASGLTIEGLDFAHSNTSVAYRWGAVQVLGNNNVLNNLVVRDMDGSCVQISGSDTILSNSTIERCGQVGINGYGERLTITNNRVAYANTRGFNQWWEAGGMKFISDSGLHSSTIRNNVVVYNRGNGIWIDWKNTKILIEGNTTAYNSGFGVYYEASQSGTIRNNLTYGNWRGIYLLDSSGSSIEGNAVFGNVMEGIAVVEGDRSLADPSLRALNNRVSGNSIAWNDFNRNWVQLVLPGYGLGSVSDSNTFKAEGLFPRMSVGFKSGTNQALGRLSDWRAATLQDYASSEQLVTLPAAIKNALQAQRLLLTTELPSFLVQPGSY